MLLLLATALASISVDDPTSCLDGDRLENELNLLLGQRTNDLNIQITIEGDGETRRSRTEVRDRDGLAWSGRLEVTEADCVALPEALALTIHSGLGALPGWSWEQARPARPVRWSNGIISRLGWPLQAGFGLESGPDVRLHRGVGWWAHGRLVHQLPVSVGPGKGSVTSLTLASGPQLTGRLLRAWLGMEAGVVWAFGQGFDENYLVRLPRVTSEIGVSVQIHPRFYAGLQALLPVTRVVLVGSGQTYTESPVYLGVSIGIRSLRTKKIEAGEVERLGRASWSR